MNTILYISLLFLIELFQSESFAKDEVVNGIKATETKAQSPEDRTIEKILANVQGAKTQYENCIQRFPTNREDLSNCLWNGDPNGNPPIKALLDNDKVRIKEIFSKEATIKPISTPGSRSPANAKSGVDLTLKSKHLSLDNSTDPVIDELKKVFQKKLNEALYGDAKEQSDSKTQLQVDHKKFNDLYKTELGKTIVDAFTSYCLDVDFASYGFDLTQMPHDKNDPSKYYFYLASNISSNRTQNIDQLKRAGLDASNGSIWSQCIGSVQNICYAKNNLVLVKTVNNVDQNVSILTTKESQNRACIIVDYVKSARKNLTIVEETDKMYSDLQKNNKSNVGLEVKASRTAAQKSLDDVVAVTTKDVKESYDKETQKLVTDMEKCVDVQGNIVDANLCKKYINTNTNELNEKFAEYSFRQYAQEDALKDKLASSKEEVEKYLKEEGYSEEKAKEMVKNDTDLNTLRAEIANRYKNEREALIADMAKKIENKTTKKDNVVDINSDKGSLASIKSDFASRPDDLKQLVFFNNVVSSFISSCKVDSSGKCISNSTSRNVASLNQELENSAVLNQNELKNLNDSANKEGLKKTSKDAGTTFDIKRINELLKYSTEK